MSQNQLELTHWRISPVRILSLTRNKAPNIGAFLLVKHVFRFNRNCMAVDAVFTEPFSVCISLYQGNLQGILHDFSPGATVQIAPKALHSSGLHDLPVGVSRIRAGN